MQLLYDERSAMRLQYFLRHDPSRLDIGGGLNALGKSLHEKWTESDTTSFVREDPQYAQVEEEIRLLRGQSWASIHEALAEVEKSPEYGKVLDEVQRRMREIDVFLRKYAA